MISRFPGSRLSGQGISGRVARPARGIVHAERLTSTSPNSALLDWQEWHLDHIEAENLGRQITLEGDLILRTRGVTEAMVSGLRGDAANRVDVLPLSLAESTLVDGSPQVYAVAVGRRVRLEWSVNPTDSDYKGAIIYWNLGDDNELPTFELARVTGPSVRSYTTQPLDDGITYVFAIAFEDHLGNESDPLDPVSVTVDRLPLPPVSVNHDLTGTLLSVTFDQPVDQHADVVGVAIYDNYLVGKGFCDSINYRREHRRFFGAFPTSGSGWTYGSDEWVSFPLFTADPALPTTWRWALRSVDKKGNESEPVLITLTLKWVDGVLTVVPDPPAAVTSFDAVPLAGALAKLTWTHDGTAVDGFKVYRDGVEVDDLDAAQRTWTSPTLTDGETYLWSVTAYNEGGESERSPVISILADGTAPTASATLTGTLVG